VIDWWNEPTRPTVEPRVERGEPPTACQWCGCTTAPDAASCCDCGAVMAQDEDLGGLLIPGVTVVDPAILRSAYTSSVIAAPSWLSAFGLIGIPGQTTPQVATAGVVLARSELGGPGSSPQYEVVGIPSQAALEMAHLLRPLAIAAPQDRVELLTAETREQTAQKREAGASR
jgi:hypothetical protein